jgi:hypothetical protein
MLNKTCHQLLILLCAAGAGPADGDWLFRQEVIADPVKGRFSVCFDHSCHTIVTQSLDSQEWSRVAALLQVPAGSPAEERAAIARAIASMETIIGRKTGTSGDQGENLPGFGLPRQMDCIDESSNTTTYLKLLQQDGLLRYHRVLPRATRFGIFAGMPHTTAVIEETASGRRYAVDSWFFDNGQPPVIMALPVWRSGWRPGREYDD